MHPALRGVSACLILAATAGHARAGFPGTALDIVPCCLVLLFPPVLIALIIVSFCILKPKPTRFPQPIPNPDPENAHDDA